MRNNHNPEELYHWGIKGMKWGVRKDRTTGGKKRRQGSTMSEDAATAKALKKKKLNELSNAELKKLNERKNLEQQYHNLNPGAVKKGLKFMGTAAAVMGTALAVYNNSNAITKAGKEVGGKIIDVAGDLVMKDLAQGLARGLRK